MIQFKSIRDRLIFWFLTISLIPMIMVSCIASYQRFAAVKNRLYDQLVAIRDLKILEINDWLDERIADITTLSKDPVIRSLESVLNEKSAAETRQPLFESVRESLNSYVQNYKDYREMYIIDAVSGRIVLSTNKMFENEDRSENPYFTEPLKTNQLYIKGIFYSKNLNTVSMTFSLPIHCKNHLKKHSIGILVLRVNLKESIYSFLAEHSGLGKTGETIIVNRDLMALNELRSVPNATLRQRIDFPAAKIAVTGKTGVIRSVDHQDQQVLAAYGYIPRLQWGVVTKQNVSEVNAPIRSMMFNFFFMMLIFVVLVYLTAVFISRSIASPVVEMTEVSKRIQAGDILARNRITSPDELGFLSKSFNLMADSMQSQIEIQQASNDITEAMVSTLNLEVFRSALFEKLMEVTESNLGVYYLYHPETKTYRHFYSAGIDPSLIQSFDGALKEGVFGEVLTTRKIAYVKDIPKDTLFQFKTIAGAMIPREMITIPVVIDEKVKAVISLASLKPYKTEIPLVLERVWWAINVTFSNLLAGEETKKLATELSEKNIKLQAQAQQLQQQTFQSRKQSKMLQEQNIKLEIKRQQVEEANRLKSQFLSTMSHELRTPLNSVLALSRVLLMQTKNKLTEEELQYLKIIERNGKNLLALINDILDLSKIEAGHVDIRPKQFAMNATLNMIAERLKPIVRKKNVAMIINYEAQSALIQSDEKRVHQILQNIISNAVKFTNKGKVTITTHCDETFFYVDVADTGIGISENQLPYIFDEFRQADGSSSRKFEGTGLGLAIASKAAKLLGGDVSVKSTINKGSVFTLRLPKVWTGKRPDNNLAESMSRSLPAAEKTVPPINSYGESANKIIVVDDDPEAARLISDSLLQEGYHTIIASSGKDVFGLALKHHPLAITLDIIMPDMDGWEVLKKLKRERQTKDIPVIIVSISEDKETGVALGAMGYVTKPVNKDALICEIKKSVAPQTASLEGVSVMIVDDDFIVRKDLKQIVEKEGMDAVVAEGGRQCIDYVLKKCPDVLVLDLMMPEMDGFEVIRLLRSNPDTMKLPIIIVTAKELSETEKKQLNGNVSTVLAKSDVTRLVLLEEIKNILMEIEVKKKFHKVMAGSIRKTDTPKGMDEDAFAVSTDGDKPKVLIIEDNPDNMFTIKAVLKDRYELYEAEDGEKGLSCFFDQRPHLVLLDIALPHMDGLNVIKMLRATEAGRDVPVIALTAQAMKGDKERMLDAGCNDYISKPFVPDQLLRAIRKWLSWGLSTAPRNEGNKLNEPNEPK